MYVNIDGSDRCNRCARQYGADRIRDGADCRKSWNKTFLCSFNREDRTMRPQVSSTHRAAGATPRSTVPVRHQLLH